METDSSSGGNRHDRRVRSAGFRNAAVALVTIGALVAASACGVDSSSGDGGSSGGGNASGEPLKVGWSTIYLTPSWMQETDKLLKDDVAELKKAGKVSDYKVFNANGNTSQQISQIRAMIQQKYDVILVDAGSSKSLNPVLKQAVNAGITVVNFDSLVSTDEVVKVGTDQIEWGRMTAQWLADKLKGKGKIIAFNGPAGVAVSEQRWKGAKKVFDKYPNIKIVSNIHSEYNLAPAAQEFASAYSAHPKINGVFSQGGTLSLAALQTIVKRNKPLIPITGENYNGFLKMWAKYKDKGFSSLSTAQPNYMGVVALRAGVAKENGVDVPSFIHIKLPKITNENLDQYVKKNQPADYYPVKELPQSKIDKLIGKK